MKCTTTYRGSGDFTVGAKKIVNGALGGGGVANYKGRTF